MIESDIKNSIKNAMVNGIEFDLTSQISFLLCVDVHHMNSLMRKRLSRVCVWHEFPIANIWTKFIRSFDVESKVYDNWLQKYSNRPTKSIFHLKFVYYT